MKIWVILLKLILLAMNNNEFHFHAAKERDKVPTPLGAENPQTDTTVTHEEAKSVITITYKNKLAK